MATARLSMREIREILRLKAERRTGREIAQSLSMGETTVRECLSRALKAGLS